MKEVTIKLKSLSGKDEGEYIITDGSSHRLYSPWLREEEEYREISNNTLTAILRDHSDITIADLAMVLLSPCDR